MSNKIGRFEILSELAKSDSACVYKATDPESGQTLALKTIRLEVFGDHADQVVERILQEAESTKDLSSSNIAVVYGAGEMEGQFCAAMEYVQGNSVATMLARKEGFSIWDLLDISRQVCQGLDHAHEHQVFHHSLEPAKIMVTWDGTVKILSFGVSSTGFAAAQAAGSAPLVLHYMSPEQVRGEPLDARSNLFSWGAMLYEMVTDRKAFDGSDADAVRRAILEEVPVAPAKLNPKINAVASGVIMKALALDPAQRYQSGREMAADLEKCREAAASKAQKKAEAPKTTLAPDKARAAAAAAKFASAPVAPKPPAPKPAPPAPVAPDAKFAPSTVSEESAAVASPVSKPVVETSGPPAQRAAAAAAGWNGASTVASGPSLDSSSQFAGSTASPSADGLSLEYANLSAAAPAPAVEKPKIAIDPMMAEDGPGASKGVSFSDLEELPPMKEVYVAPAPVKAEEPAEAEALPSIVMRPREPEKPKVDPREVAEKAIKEIKGVPPKLMGFAIAGAIAVVLVIAGTIAWRSHSQSTDEEGTVPRQATSAESAPRAASPVAQTAPAVAVAAPAPAAPQADAPPEAPAPDTAPKAAPVPAKAKNTKKKAAPAPAPVVVGEISVESTPEGAQVQIDGRGDSNWVTPYVLTGLTPGSHTVVLSKSGFGQETHTIDVTAGAKASLVVHLTQLNAVLSVSSDPAGAAVYVDGKDTLRLTPTQITLEKGTHTILVRKPGYLDETTSVTGQPGQNSRFAPTLRALGNADDIKTVGKFKKLFGGGNAQAGMGKVTVRTTPKGAQIAINRRMLDKNTPVEFLLNPGNYVVDITATGYRPLQRIITVEKDGTVSIDEALQPQ